MQLLGASPPALATVPCGSCLGGWSRGHETCSNDSRLMLNQDGSHYESQVAPQRQDTQGSAESVGLDRQVRETVEALRLKVENLRLFLSWRK
jgi:hypothetical protein